ncbi:hypothetical protein [Mucilaginibacter myungsuensis]|uniref:Uncharacterized protein n=1 Tax=Mucilaginibacter myungsuensis TaxID=649104 RepID=A0A929KXB7_9SPHI|nr:hypothetical protein [Mucilaginibacter myungsuensis]MBE9662200.1 hypothetical protein [Mucilaginibacter myungsuensis]MDN3599366.1 hypothetical protein [Mucilaginibacter myungsuensis]
MSKQPTQRQLRRRIRVCIWIVIVGLFVSGVTAFPLESELAVIKDYIPAGVLNDWITKIYNTLHDVNLKYPYLSYGTDWLAFAHVMLAILFIGPLRDPKKNIWVIQFGMIACVAILPLAFIAGPIRQIPFFWRLIDSSFGVFGIIPLWLAHGYVKRLRN